MPSDPQWVLNHHHRQVAGIKPWGRAVEQQHIARATRRTVLAGIAATLAPSARAQQAAIPVIGILGLQSSTSRAALENNAAFVKGLAESGFIVERDIAIDYRYAEDQPERLPSLAQTLVVRGVALLMSAGGPVTARAASEATKDIPIVAAVGADFVELGLAQSLNRRGGNVTGIMFRTVDLEPKRLQLLRELVPSARSIGVVGGPDTTSPSLDDAAGKLVLTLHSVRLERERAISMRLIWNSHGFNSMGFWCRPGR